MDFGEEKKKGDSALPFFCFVFPLSFDGQTPLSFFPFSRGTKGDVSSARAWSRSREKSRRECGSESLFFVLFDGLAEATDGRASTSLSLFSPSLSAVGSGRGILLLPPPSCSLRVVRIDN